ncbi:polyubiquitin-tagged protein recognition complex, Npl4 component [Rickenella mellea]|uniref:Nuclear protein localization protein 4 n=1 Tax=Rickenella mellea TaxID=50990 RepID=A0A4Y7QMY1_9AGAM|nr:polyubiquitin-tagged protein recognition complex, Npl4 component [Rickenella mellea]
MLVRVRSKDGNFRFDVQPTTDISELLHKILETTQNADPSTITFSNQPRGGEVNVSTLKGRNMQSLGLKHGDLLFVGYQSHDSAPSTASATAPAQDIVQPDAKRPWETVQEDPVDTYWRKHDGKIPRSRDSRFCKHGANAMCDYCMPLEPYDPKYHTEHSIKHLSYHAYLRKISPASSSSSSASSLPPLTPLSYKVKNPCPNANHPPWPAGICTACQPSAITLQPQPFRMVDHLEFAGHEMVDRFLQAWRRTGTQRFGWLIGRYEPYDEVPMGVKAVVEAIHEPPQEGELDGLTLGLPWEDEQRIRGLAASASTPLTIVGYMFTDLDPSEDDRTKNVYKRHPGSYYLTCLEAIFAAHMQLHNPMASRSSPTGSFASRLVTAVATATEEGSVDIAAYQVSEQACAMVDADMIEASVDPGIVRVKPEDRSQDAARYVPDVFFRYKNEYGLEVKKSAKPAFPVEYLLVNVTHGFPQNPQPLFSSNQFTIENRSGLEDQDIQAVLKSLQQLRAPNISPGSTGQDALRRELATYLSDWHLVAFLGTTQLFSEDDMKVLVRTISRPLQDIVAHLDELLVTESWHTLMTFTSESAPKSVPSNSNSNTLDDLPQDIREQLERMQQEEREAGSGSGTPGSGGMGVRICPHCTFENTHGGSDCEVCGLPLG